MRFSELKVFPAFILVTMIYSGSLAFSPKEKRNMQMIDNTVLEIKTAESEKNSYRAIIGKSKSAYYLKIEKFERSPNLDGLGKLIETINAFELPGGKNIKSKDNWVITELKWNASGVTFKNEITSGSILKTVNCEINVFSQHTAVICK